VPAVSKPPIDPVIRRDIPEPPARAKRKTSETPFPPARLVPLSGDAAEDAVSGGDGRVFTGVEGGRILRVDIDRQVEETVGDTGGRPLGLELLPGGRLLVCDSHRGLLRLDPETREIETLVAEVDDVPLRFCSNAAAASDGTIWFTQSSHRFGFEHHLGAILEHRPSGRLFRRDPEGAVELVRDDLHFANGVALTEDESAVLFAETGAARVSRLDVSTGEVTVIAENMPGYPDNLSRVRDGRFWVAIPNPRDAMLERLATSPPLLRKALWRVPDRVMPEGTRTTWVMQLDTEGNVIRDLQDDRRDFHMATGVDEHDGRVVVASVRHRALLVLDPPAV
jgi:sugar lactone lactonase YvrE